MEFPLSPVIKLFFFFFPPYLGPSPGPTGKGLFSSVRLCKTSSSRGTSPPQIKQKEKMLDPRILFGEEAVLSSDDTTQALPLPTTKGRSQFSMASKPEKFSPPRFLVPSEAAEYLSLLTGFLPR